MWRRESFQALVWSLGLIADIPSHDTITSDDLLRAYPPTDLGSYLKSARLRPRREIDRQRDIAELWHWRSRTRQLMEEGRPFESSPSLVQAGIVSYDDVVRASAARAAEDGLATLVDGDSSVMRKAYRDLTDDEWANVRSISVERHFAFNWICGRAPSNRWDETPTDT